MRIKVKQIFDNCVNFMRHEFSVIRHIFSFFSEMFFPNQDIYIYIYIYILKVITTFPTNHYVNNNILHQSLHNLKLLLIQVYNKMVYLLCVLCVFLQRLLSLLLKQQRIWVLKHWKSRQTAPTPSKVKIHNCVLVYI